MNKMLIITKFYHVNFVIANFMRNRLKYLIQQSAHMQATINKK
ncbi:hypothetical protein Q5C_07195 [Leuconostoc pseudomesenteroides 4882]|nr:hypothetical protein L964_1411 [Leuconostoc pseudomesenteroides 1159]CCJ66735.1 hypothetical protein Q5C_07195 [Leuconostoc pseudomesenteroides 4882]